MFRDGQGIGSQIIGRQYQRLCLVGAVHNFCLPLFDYAVGSFGNVYFSNGW
jgi:hypothetical protein